MQSEKPDSPQENKKNLPGASAVRNTARNDVQGFTAEELKQCLLISYNMCKLFEEIIQTTETVFEFIWRSDIEQSTRMRSTSWRNRFSFIRGWWRRGLRVGRVKRASENWPSLYLHYS